MAINSKFVSTTELHFTSEEVSLCRDLRKKGYSDWKILNVIFAARKSGKEGFNVNEPEFRYISDAVQEVAGKQKYSEAQAPGILAKLAVKEVSAEKRMEKLAAKEAEIQAKIERLTAELRELQK